MKALCQVLQPARKAPEQANPPPWARALNMKLFFAPKLYRRPTSVNLQTSDVCTTLEQKIISYLKREPMEADSLARALCVPAAKLGTTLSLMQLKGVINQESGKYYVD